MSETRQRYDDEFKKNAVKLSYASSKTVKEIAGDLGISVSLLYRWRKKYTPEGEKTQFATMEPGFPPLHNEAMIKNTIDR